MLNDNNSDNNNADSRLEREVSIYDDEAGKFVTITGNLKGHQIRDVIKDAIEKGEINPVGIYPRVEYEGMSWEGIHKAIENSVQEKIMSMDAAPAPKFQGMEFGDPGMEEGARHLTDEEMEFGKGVEFPEAAHDLSNEEMEFGESVEFPEAAHDLSNELQGEPEDPWLEAMNRADDLSSRQEEAIHAQSVPDPEAIHAQSVPDPFDDLYSSFEFEDDIRQEHFNEVMREYQDDSHKPVESVLKSFSNIEIINNDNGRLGMSTYIPASKTKKLNPVEHIEVANIDDYYNSPEWGPDIEDGVILEETPFDRVASTKLDSAPEVESPKTDSPESPGDKPELRQDNDKSNQKKGGKNSDNQKDPEGDVEKYKLLSEELREKLRLAEALEERRSNAMMQQGHMGSSEGSPSSIVGGLMAGTANIASGIIKGSIGGAKEIGRAIASSVTKKKQPVPNENQNPLQREPPVQEAHTTPVQEAHTTPVQESATPPVQEPPSVEVHTLPDDDINIPLLTHSIKDSTSMNFGRSSNDQHNKWSEDNINKELDSLKNIMGLHGGALDRLNESDWANNLRDPNYQNEGGIAASKQQLDFTNAMSDIGSYDKEIEAKVKRIGDLIEDSDAGSRDLEDVLEEFNKTTQEKIDDLPDSKEKEEMAEKIKKIVESLKELLSNLFGRKKETAPS